METAHPITLAPALIVDDDPALRRRLLALLTALEPAAADAGMAGSLAEARHYAANHALNVALVDIGLPDGSGVDLIAELTQLQPQLTCVAVSAWGQEEIVLAALRAGAVGYLLKEREDLELTLALRSIQRGGAPIDPTIARRILLAVQAAPAPEAPAASPLSERERQILGLVAKGYSNREIAELTELSRFTIEDYTKNIYRKLAVRSRTAAVFEANARGLLG